MFFSLSREHTPYALLKNILLGLCARTFPFSHEISAPEPVARATPSISRVYIALVCWAGVRGHTFQDKRDDGTAASAQRVVLEWGSTRF